ncbi:hypothetical protein VC83_07744 [Pseudogymnoascus destructans]|uniref:2EXR domain-containing protein n=1 Tax=Pseudogymnoascus destructans TaxID=655981 RepID=A0A177A3Y6_9PEZI|nr:uncharacterized protein VC83_07744 [Pseudogymnoascus destructans]OAF55793.1 hypothetical protein VC83_07744 [Pseudogymnoascus destructans]
MAKRKPTLTLVEMERKLGYRIDSSNYPEESVKRFYSDLRPVPSSVYERTKAEFEEHEKQRSAKADDIILEEMLPDFDIIDHGLESVIFTRRSHVGFYTFAVDIHYGFGFDLPLLLTKNEAFRAMTVPKLQVDRIHGLESMFFKLPKELRDKIYAFALPAGKWQIEDVDNFNELIFAKGIGDPSGFYFSLSSHTMLRVNRQMRQEALCLAYRQMVFHLDDMDDLIKLLIAIGDIGRDNIESLELAWHSGTDLQCQWAEAPGPNGHSLTLPTLHVAKCVQLLKHCKRLRYLRLYFDSDLILGMSPGAYKADPGICELSSIRGIRRVDICDSNNTPLEHSDFVEWLKEEMESSNEAKKDKIGVGKQ